MKISSREKFLLGILLTALIIVGYYELVFVNQRAIVNKLKNTKAETEMKYNTVMDTVNSLDKKKEDLKVLKSKIYDKSEKLYPTIIQEKIIVELDDLLKKSNVNGSISFSDISVKGIELSASKTQKLPENSFEPFIKQYNGDSTSNTSEKNDTNNPSKDTSLNVEQIKVTLNYTGTYDNLMKLISNIEQNSKKIVLSNLVVMSGGTTQVNGSLVLNYYSVPKVDKQDEDYFNWTLNNNYGKSNPFDIGVTSTSVTKSNNYDFIMTARASKSDLATVGLRYASDKKMETGIYADSNSPEDVEITLSQKDGKYYYKYKTSRESYPKGYSGTGVQFNPNGSNILIDIISNIRLDDNDKSGVNLKVINSTDKEVSVNIIGDDSSRPRVKVTSEGKTVNITNSK
ncbi:hypothetical protein [Clostridium paridis]|uniref:Pilus assembly protein PilO n=1 Tax=Clostridium paridis TaxID=2803863 RepID=A0A937K5S0_9CLOT|nr:hypothetical protein [Clostridium paridis]MBL4933359.1 hypothetical protein [Clostridium paridis]